MSHDSKKVNPKWPPAAILDFRKMAASQQLLELQGSNFAPL
jgi:hypothetical protein